MKMQTIRPVLKLIVNAIDPILSMMVVVVFSPIANVTRKIGLTQLPHTKKQLSRAGINYYWPTESDPIYSDLSLSRPIAIGFQGGLGAQIVSAAIYFYLFRRGYSVYADFSYFNNEVYLAMAGDGRCSQWEYRLEGYGFPMSSFRGINQLSSDEFIAINDGALKVQLFQKAITDPEVREYFPVSIPRQILESIDFFGLHSVKPNSYICMHIRRGDYMNSSVHHIVPENNFLVMAAKFSKLYSTIVITSDSKLSQEFITKINEKFTNAVFLDGMKIDDLATHSIMRLASILFCSNSQFSMTAGFLNDGFAFIPTKFFENGQQQELEKVIYESYAEFSLLNV